MLSPRLVLTGLACRGCGVRYELVDDIVRMAARGRYVPKGDNMDGRMMVYNIGNLATNLDMSKAGKSVTGLPGEGAAAESPKVANMTTKSNEELVQTLTKQDPSTRAGNEFRMLGGAAAENEV